MHSVSCPPAALPDAHLARAGLGPAAVHRLHRQRTQAAVLQVQPVGFGAQQIDETVGQAQDALDLRAQAAMERLVAHAIDPFLAPFQQAQDVGLRSPQIVREQGQPAVALAPHAALVLVLRLQAGQGLVQHLPVGVRQGAGFDPDGCGPVPRRPGAGRDRGAGHRSRAGAASPRRFWRARACPRFGLLLHSTPLAHRATGVSRRSVCVSGALHICSIRQPWDQLRLATTRSTSSP
jgi:hypothetical protein